jgi:hypothetical protein
VTNKKLSPCKTCNQEISLSAKTCPKCGEKNPCKRPKEVPKALAWFIIGFAVLGGIGAITSDTSTLGSGLSSAAGYPADASRALCEKAIMVSANNPSTVDIQSFVGYATDVLGNGNRRITQTFSAKNGFGLKTTYDAYCTITPSGELDIKIVEQGRL